MKSRMKHLMAGVVCLAAIGAGGSGFAQQPSGQLTVYTALLPSVLAPYAAAFNEAYPDVKINWVREAGGMLAARIIAEKADPKADVIWGLPVPEIITLDQAGLIERYSPKGVEELKPLFVDAVNKPPAWTGLDMFLNLICFNTVEAEKRGIPKPESWADLTKPVYAGQITMPSPQMSGTGYAYIMAWIQSMGEDKAWTYIDALNKNVASYTNSSSTRCKQAAAGEYVVGLSTDFNASPLKSKGAPIDLLVPSDGTGWGIEASALPKGSKKPELAKLLLDFSISQKANEAYAKYYGIVARNGIKSSQPNAVENGDQRALKIDIAWGNDNRDRILNKWGAQYQAKSEPKPAK